MEVCHLFPLTMLRPLLTSFLLPLLLLSGGCDSEPEGPQLGGVYDGSQTVAFTSSSQNVTIAFDIQLDIDTPGSSGAFTGDITFERGAVGNASPVIGRGTVSGTVNGTDVSLAGRASNFASRTSRHGGGLALDATGTLREDGTLVLSQATIGDFAYGTSDSFSMTLTK